MPRLTELEPYFVRAGVDGAISYVDSPLEAQGILFLCPKCFVENKGPVGTHCVLVWFRDRGVPPEFQPTPRWVVSGTGMSDLTTSPSIHIRTGCGYHGFLTNGEATSC